MKNTSNVTHTHTCEITLLNDDRKAKKSLYGPEIYVLIQDIAKEKISFIRSADPDTLDWAPQTVQTFQCHKHDWQQLLQDTYPDLTSISTTILTNAFQI